MRTGSHVQLPQKCDLCPIQHRSVCAAAGGRIRPELNRISHRRTFSAGETIVGEAEEAGIVGNVVRGVLRMVRTMADGRQQIVGLLFPSDMFGRVFASHSRYAIEAATDVELCCFDRGAFEALLVANPDVEHEVLLSTLDELDAARDWMVLLGCQTVLERVAAFLIIVRRRMMKMASDEWMPGPHVSVPIGRRDMATYLGTTVESISRTIRAMARRGVIRIIDAQNFEVVQWNRLVALSGREEFDFDDGIVGLRSYRHVADAGSEVRRTIAGRRTVDVEK